MAGEIADGALIDSRYSTHTVVHALCHVADGRAEARADARPFGTALFLACAPGHDADRRLAEEAVRQEVPPGGVFGVGGTAEQILDGLAAYRDLGVDAIALQPLGPLDGMADFIATAGEVHSRGA